MDLPLQTPQFTSASGVQIPVSPDDFDSYDDDLNWILERLIERSGAVQGVIVRYGDDDDGSVVVARQGEPCDSAMLPKMIAAGSSVVYLQRRNTEDVARMQQSLESFEPTDGTRTNVRLLCMAFVPARSVCLVAIVCFADARELTTPQHITVVSLYSVLSRYTRLWWMHRTELRRANALSAALDLAAIGVIVLARCGEILFENAKATALMQVGEGLRRQGHTLGTQKFAEGARFQAAIQHAVQRNRAPHSEATYSRSALIVSLSRQGKRALLATVVAADRVAFDMQDPAVIVYVLDPDQDVKRLVLPVCHLYRLTAAETRLVLHLVDGLDLKDAARSMNVQPQTARSYLKQVFVKTRTKRQSDLIRLMFGSLLRTNCRTDLSLLQSLG